MYVSKYSSNHAAYRRLMRLFTARRALNAVQRGNSAGPPAKRPAAVLPLLYCVFSAHWIGPPTGWRDRKHWSGWRDSNPRPLRPELHGTRLTCLDGSRRVSVYRPAGRIVTRLVSGETSRPRPSRCSPVCRRAFPGAWSGDFCGSRRPPGALEIARRAPGKRARDRRLRVPAPRSDDSHLGVAMVHMTA
ncbi:MAG: hypothetical protein QOF95_2568 [Pseudonocardiales bacterium]|nr:hypothetical protein [Pseudonocardiales bacterium]